MSDLQKYLFAKPVAHNTCNLSVLSCVNQELCVSMHAALSAAGRKAEVCNE